MIGDVEGGRGIDAARQARPAMADMVGTWSWDIADDRMHADDVAGSLFGADLERLAKGAPLRVFAACIHPDDRDTVIARMHQGAAQGGSFVAEFRVRDAAGRTLWVLSRARYERGGDGRPARAHGILVDMTGSALSETAYDHCVDARPGCSLEQAAEACISARAALVTADRPFLVTIVDMLLLEIGREIGRSLRRAYLRRLS